MKSGSLNPAESAILEHLAMITHVGRRNAEKFGYAASQKYTSAAEVLLTYGRFFDPAPLPNNVQAGLPKQGYTNASLLQAEHPDWAYVEGMGSIISMPELVLEHAWCAGQSTAIDPTWPDGAAYFGIPFTVQYREHVQQTAHTVSLLTYHEGTRTVLREGLEASALVDIGRLAPVHVDLKNLLETTE